MKKIKNLKLFLTGGLGLMLFTLVLSCDEDQNPFLDVNNPANSLGVFGPDNALTYNPVENVQNEVIVGVSTLSDSDRTFVLSLDEEDTTLEDNFYTIESLTGVIPAGSFTGSIVITTLGGENTDLPVATRVVSLNLESIEGAVLETGTTDDVLSLVVSCPEVLTEDDLVGSWQITVDPFVTCIGDCVFEVVAGPGPNQVTALDFFDHPNPAGGVYDVVWDVDYDSATINVAAQDAWHCDNFGCGFGQATVETEGPGDAFNCIGTGTLKFVFRHRVAAGTFGAFAMEMEKL